MSLRLQLTTGTLTFLACLALMTYAVLRLSGTPYLLAMVMLWLGVVEYAVVRAWWVDVRELLAVRQERS